MLPFIVSSIGPPDKKEFYTRLYRAYYPAMARQAYQVMGGSRDVEDIVQDALVRLIRQYEKLRTLSEAHLAYYTLLTVKTTAIDLLRRRGRDKEHAIRCAGEDAAGPLTPEQQYISEEERGNKIRALSFLPEAERDLLLYKYVLEKPNRELAAIYGTSEANIRQMLCRTRRKLCGFLEDMR